jgi:putative peptidoglycan lipid II flippase
MSILKSASTIAFFTLISRVLGFARDITIAALLGTTALADTFFVAFRLPNFFRTLFAEGAFSAAFVPTFTSVLSKDGRENAIKFAEKMFAVMLWVLLIFTIIMQIAMPFVMLGLAPGFTKNPAQFDMAVYLTRITFPYLLFISLVSLLGGVLNSLNKFAAAAAAPIFLNLTLILAPLLLDKYTATPAHSLSWSVAIAGVVQFIWLYYNCVREGIWIKPRSPTMPPEVKKALKLMVPGIIAAGAVQINLWISTLIATLVPNTVSTLYYADRINQLPLAIIGVALGTAILPLLSRQMREGKLEDANKTINEAIFVALFFTLPAATGFLGIAYPIMATLFERGAFTAADSLASAQPLIAYGFGLPAFVLIKVLVPGFFAAENTKTPVKIATFCIFVNLPLTWFFVHYFPLIGLNSATGIAAATTISAWINAGTLFVLLKRHGRLTLLSQTRRNVFFTLLLALFMGAVIWVLSLQFVGAPKIVRPIYLSGLLGAAILLYFGLGYVFKIYTLTELKSWLKRRKKNGTNGTEDGRK